MILKSIRKEKGLTQSKASSFLQIPLRTYKRLETNNDQKNFKYVKACESLLSIDNHKKSRFKSHLNFGIIGCGYVGIPLATALSEIGNVFIHDSNDLKLKTIKDGKMPITDNSCFSLFSKNYKTFNCTHSVEDLLNTDICFVCVPTDIEKKRMQLNTSAVEGVVSELYRLKYTGIIAIKSTLPIGYTNYLISKYSKNIIYLPEFLREGFGYYDLTNPSRIVLGVNSDFSRKNLKIITNVLERIAINGLKASIVGTKEAESIKLFSNEFLAMRVAFFNEIDTFMMLNGINSFEVIDSICRDPRIGRRYNNPSFGFGGSCLEKDSLQATSSLKKTNNHILAESIVESNERRIKLISDAAIDFAKKMSNKKKPVFGFYKLGYKKDGDNLRFSASMKIFNYLIKLGYETIVYDEKINDIHSVSFEDLVRRSDLILADRIDDRIKPYLPKVFTRDLFNT